MEENITMPWTSASALPSSPGKEEHDTDRIKIIMDPGMAFGTGTHETILPLP